MIKTFVLLTKVFVLQEYKLAVIFINSKFETYFLSSHGFCCCRRRCCRGGFALYLDIFQMQCTVRVCECIETEGMSFWSNLINSKAQRVL